MDKDQETAGFSEEVELIKPVVEAVLFASEHPLTIIELNEIIEGSPRNVLNAAIAELKEEYGKKSRGVNLLEVSGGYHFRTKPEYSEYIIKLTKTKPARLSQSSLEALAIIAYKQPIMKSEIEEIRGVDSTNVIRTLLEKRLIKIIGKKDTVGKPLLYATTSEFLEVFSLKSLSSLPTLKNIKELEAGVDDSQLSLL